LILRAYMSRRQYGQRTLGKFLAASLFDYTVADDTVAELILTSISPLFLINGLVDLWQRHMETRNHIDDNRHFNNNTDGNYNNGANGTNGVNTHHDNITDQEGRKNITWVKIVSAYVFSSFIIVPS
jgi:hypothetical protein